MKFDQSDTVEYNGNKAKVLTGWKTMFGIPKYKIRMIEGPHAGTVLDVPEDKLAKAETPNGWFGWVGDDYQPRSKLMIDRDKNCPACGCEWIVTEFNNKVWYDCKRCKKNKEQILKDLSG